MSEPRARLVHQQALAAEDAARELAARLATRESAVEMLKRERAKDRRRLDRLARDIARRATSRDVAIVAAQINALVREALYDLSGTPKRQRDGCEVPAE
jgi:hypothetical protein